MFKRRNPRLTLAISLIALFVLTAVCAVSRAQTAGTVTLTATPTSGNGVISVSLNWTSTPAATSCALTGGGVTNPTAAGSGTVTDSITKTTVYSVACNWTRTTNTLHWTAPTANTDGSALTDLTSYTIWWGLTGVTSSSSTQVTNPAATSYVITPPGPGTYVYDIVACNSAKLCSAASPSVTGPPIGTTTATATATTTVTPIPSAPTNVTVQ